jgi:uncharacterized protein involved in exopolysaccharide biosynthesis
MDDRSPLWLPRHDTASIPAPASAVKRSDYAFRPLAMRFLAGFLSVILISMVAWPLLPRRYESTAGVIFRSVDQEGRIDRSQSLRSPLDESAMQSEMDMMTSPASELIVIARHKLAQDPEFSGSDGLRARITNILTAAFPAAAQWIPAQTPPTDAELRRRLQDHLLISRDRRSYTVKLGYWSSDPGKAAAMTQTLLNAYLESQSRRRESGDSALTVQLAEHVKAMRERYERSQEELRSQSGSTLMAESARAALQARLDSLTAEAANAHAESVIASAKAEVLAAAGESNSALNEVRASMKHWQLRENAARKAADILTAELSAAGDAAGKLEATRHNVQVNRDLLSQATARLKELETRLDTSGPGVEILSNAELPSRAAFPNPLMMIASTLLLALAAGFAMIWRPVSAAALRFARA